VYNKNCGEEMFGEKIYPALRGNLMNQVVFKNMGGKITEVMLKWVPNPKEKVKTIHQYHGRRKVLHEKKSIHLLPQHKVKVHRML